MIAYSVTVSIDRDIEKDWSAWMRDVHIPDVMAAGYFEKYEMHRTLEDEAGDRAKYIIRYYCSSLQRYRDYQLKAARGSNRSTQSVTRVGSKRRALSRKS